LIEQSQTQSVASSISSSKKYNRKAQQHYNEREVETLGAVQRKGN